MPEEEAVGVAIIRRALEEPLWQISANAGHEGAVVIAKVREMKAEEGFNASTEAYENLVEAGVIDPTKVVRTALQNAASVASLMLTTEALVAERGLSEAVRAPAQDFQAAEDAARGIQTA